MIENISERGIMTLTHGKRNGGPGWTEKKYDGSIGSF
jgi:hypothetical protein